MIIIRNIGDQIFSNNINNNWIEVVDFIKSVQESEQIVDYIKN